MWKIKKFQGGTEQTLRCKVSPSSSRCATLCWLASLFACLRPLQITLASAHSNTVRKEIGPISMQFEIPMYNPSGSFVRSPSGPIS